MTCAADTIVDTLGEDLAHDVHHLGLHARPGSVEAPVHLARLGRHISAGGLPSCQVAEDVLEGIHLRAPESNHNFLIQGPKEDHDLGVDIPAPGARVGDQAVFAHAVATIPNSGIGVELRFRRLDAPLVRAPQHSGEVQPAGPVLADKRQALVTLLEAPHPGLRARPVVVGRINQARDLAEHGSAKQGEVSIALLLEGLVHLPVDLLGWRRRPTISFEQPALGLKVKSAPLAIISGLGRGLIRLSGNAAPRRGPASHVRTRPGRLRRGVVAAAA
mmetsp:Transcript_87976/g.188724  ORF Transcript_87976/g.188724 Transcript_87976/m.188724 type:complete len:274 (-) Transcript_87976:6-827(-)